MERRADIDVFWSYRLKVKGLSIALLTGLFIQSISLAQDVRYHPLIPGMEHHRDGKYNKPLRIFKRHLSLSLNFLTVTLSLTFGYAVATVCHTKG